MANNQIVDYEAILKQFEGSCFGHSEEGLYYEKTDVIKAMKEAIRQAIPIILEHVAERAYSSLSDDEDVIKISCDKSSITGQKDELEKLFGI